MAYLLLSAMPWTWQIPLGISFAGSFRWKRRTFVWGDVIPLPWAETYWRHSARDGTPISITAEVQTISLLLFSIVGKGPHQECPWLHATYIPDVLCCSERSKIQGLAVEAMLSVDGFLQLIERRKWGPSFEWLAAAYNNIIECTIQAQRIHCAHGMDHKLAQAHVH